MKMVEKKKVLILGGTGAMGSFLVKLLSDKYVVSVTSRRVHENTENVNYFLGDAHSMSFIEEILKQQYDVIIDFMYYEIDEFEKRLQLLLSSTNHYFFISSSRVYADSGKPITETSPRLLDVMTGNKALPDNDYAIVKAKEENLLKSSSFSNWTIIRPYMTYFKNRLDLGYYPKELWLYRVMNGRSIILPELISNKQTTLTYGFDVARGIASLIGKDDVKGNVFHITQSYSCTWNEILDIYITALEKNGYRVNSYITDLSGDHETCIFKYDRAYDRVFDNEKINTYINTTDFLNPKAGLSSCLEEFVKQPHFLKIDWALQAYWDRLLKEKTPLVEIKKEKDKMIYLFYRYVLPFSTVRFIYRKIKSLLR